MKNVYQRVKDILSSNKELKDHQVFIIMLGDYSRDSSLVLRDWWSSKIPFTYSAVERAVRKAREENEELRDSGYDNRKTKQTAKMIHEVRQISQEEKESREFNYMRTEQASIL